MQKTWSKILLLASVACLMTVSNVSFAQDYYAYHDSEGGLEPAQARASNFMQTQKLREQGVATQLPTDAQFVIAPQMLKTIVIDPGHGGENLGAIGIAGVYEKELTLDLSIVLAERLREAYPDAKILMTRTSDEFVELSDRIAFANAHQADVFLSLHFNGADNLEAYGFESFWVGDFWKTEPDVHDPKSQAVRIDAGQRSQWLGECFNQAMGARLDGLDRGVKPGDYTVLTQAKVPAVVLEFAFLSHAEEGVKVLDIDYRAEMVEALVDALDTYVKGKVASGSLP